VGARLQRGIEARGPLIRRGPLLYLVALVLLAGALLWDRTRGSLELEPPLLRIFPEASTFQPQGGILQAYDSGGTLLAWAATGSANGYGGPMTLLVGIDTLGGVAGVEVVEHRETPIFWRMVRAPTYFEHVTGTGFRQIDYAYSDVVAVTGATLSSDAIVASVRAAVAAVAGEAFDVRIPLPQKPFEFGLLELVILALFALGVVGHRMKGPLRRRLRWAGQITGLLVLGFWKNSPITLAKITAVLSGYLPDLRTGVAIYLLLAGFFLTSVLYGRNLYCLHACPFGAAQRVNWSHRRDSAEASSVVRPAFGGHAEPRGFLGPLPGLPHPATCPGGLRALRRPFLHEGDDPSVASPLHRPGGLPGTGDALVQLLLPHADRGSRPSGRKTLVEGEEGGERGMKKRWGWADVATLFLALLTFGVIVAVLVQNFLNLE
jgi:hypothetical protein